MEAEFMKKTMVFIISLLMMAGSAIASDTKIILGTSEWAPYLGSKLNNGGVTVDITKAAFKKAGYDAEVQFMDWNRAVGLAQKGKIAGIVGCYKTAERAKTFGITNTIGSVELVFFQKKDANIKFNGLESLKPYKIGVMRGSAHTDEFDSAPFLAKESADKIELNIKKLIKGRINLFLGSKLVTLDKINKQLPQDAKKIEVVHPPLKSNSLHLGIAKKTDGYEKIVNDFKSYLRRWHT